MLGFFVPSAEQTFVDDFTSMPTWRNALPTGINKFRNSEFFIPSDQAFPENWFVTPGAGITVTYTKGTSTINSVSVPHIDMRITGTKATAQNALFVFESPGPRVPGGQQWRFSFYAAHVAGSLTGVTNSQIALEYYDASDNYLNGSNVTFTPTGTMTRVTAGILSPANTFYVYPYFLCNLGVGTHDVTFRFAGPQLEQNTAPTTLVQTNSNVGLWNSGMSWHPAIINSEQQYYPDLGDEGTSLTGGVNPLSVSSSVLTITATVKNGSATTTQPYISGAFQTRKGFQQRFGYFEARMAQSLGGGLWPAFWLLPSIPTGTSAEIDIMEWPGYQNIMDAVSMTVHYSSNPTVSDGQAVPVGSSSFVSSFHTYGVEWRNDKLVWYIDRVRKRTVNTPSDCKVPFYILFNLAIGGTYTNGITNTGQIPATLQIDYVKVWDRLPF